jgi:hypothetical protein
MSFFHIFAAMKKIVHNLNVIETKEKPQRENVWCKKYGYFIDLDACRARSLQQKTCRSCYASLIQVPLPF